MSKAFKDLSLNNSFLFMVAMNDPETCKLVLEIILGRKISKVNVKVENMFMFSSEVKCIRLDAHAVDEFNVNYDIEAQNEKNGNIAKRSRYYQAEMDVTFLKPGQSYNMLPDSYVIFICTFDPFGRGLYRYTYTEKCEEDGQALEDGTVKIFLNTKGKNKEDVPEFLVEFLSYFEDSTDRKIQTIKDESIKQLHHKVTILKRSRELESGYMKFEELLMEKEAKGKLKGWHNAILTVLLTKGQVSEALFATIKNEYREEFLESWIKLASSAQTVQEFEEAINQS